MKIFLISHRCGHCVHYQLVTGTEQFEACVESRVGTLCWCGVRVQDGDIQVVVPDTHMKAITDGSFPWNKVNLNEEGFAGFSGTGVAPSFQRGEFANALRGRMYEQADKARNSELETISAAMTELLAFSFGHEAYKEHNFTRAVMWLERAAPVQDDPTHTAGAYMYLGMSWLELGEHDKAKAALSKAVADTAASPVIRGSAGDQLGSLLKRLGDVAGARTAYQTAVDLQVDMFSAKAALNLGTLEDELGNHEKARSLWEFVCSEASDDTE